MAQHDDQNDIAAYATNYSEQGFWHKLRRHSGQLGHKTLRTALGMYYAAQDSATPKWARTTLYGALGYFVSPIDAIPDITPLVGYTDDIGVMTAAAAIVAAHITADHTARAERRLQRLFRR